MALEDENVDMVLLGEQEARLTKNTIIFFLTYLKHRCVHVEYIIDNVFLVNKLHDCISLYE